jgi:predicted RND superfamily exporter protein
MAASLPERIFSNLASLSLARPGLVLLIAGVLFVGAGAVIPRLHVSTSRYGLVSPDNPEQARMLRFFDRFGNPDAPVMVISGGAAADRRAVVDRLVARLEAVPELHGRVLARVGPREVAEVLLLQKPEMLSQVTGGLPPGLAIGPLVEGGLPAWLGALEGQLQAGLDGEAAPQDPAKAAEGLKQLGGLAGTFDAYLRGEDVLSQAMAADKEGVRPGRDEAGYIVTVDGQHHVVSMFPEFAGNEVSDFAPLIGKIEAARDEAIEGAPEGVQAALTGLPELAVEEQRVVTRGLFMSSVWSGLAIIVLCLFMLRSIRQTALSLTPVLGGVAMTLGATYLIYGYLNLVTSSFVAVLLGLGIDFGVHMIHRFNEQRRAGSGVREAIDEAVVHTGPAILIGALVTMAAFLTLIGSDFTAFVELGVITAIGLLFVVLSTLFTLPSLLAFAGNTGLAAVKKEPPGIRSLVGLVSKLRIPIVIVALGGAVAGGWGLTRIDFNGRYFDFLPQDLEAVQALGTLEHDPLMSPIYANVAAHTVEEGRAKAESLRALPQVAGVQTATDLLPPLDEPRMKALRAAMQALGPAPDFAKLATRASTPEELAPKVKKIVDALDEVRYAMEQGGQPTAPVEEATAGFRALQQRLEKASAEERARLAAIEPALADLLGRAWTTAAAVAERGHYLPTDLPALFRARFVARDGNGLALFVVPAKSPWESEGAKEFRTAVAAIAPDVSGMAVNIDLHSTMIVTGFRRAALLAGLLILIVVCLDLRSIRDGVFALVPTVLGWLWMLALMAAVGQKFDVANIVSLPLVIGIGTAFGVHLMHRAQESARSYGTARLDDLVRSTGGAVVLSALTTIASFTALMFGGYGGMFSFGLVMVMGIASSLMASLFVLPALLLMFRQVREH